MKIYLHEIKEIDTELEFDESTEWLANVLIESDEDKLPIETVSLKKVKPLRKINLNINLRAVDNVYIASGNLDSHIDLLCSRCATSFELPLHEHFSHLFSKDKELAGISYLKADGSIKNKNIGHARHAASIPSEEQFVESTDDLEMTYVAEDFIDLTDLLKEVISLRIPYQPLCKEDCKGVCMQCGTDLNVGRCACAKIVKENPFSVLKKLQLENTATLKTSTLQGGKKEATVKGKK